MKQLRVLYIGKHNSGGNDDEGAITFALEQLGHKVTVVREQDEKSIDSGYAADFLLANHFQHPELLERYNCPKVFWCFDRIHLPDEVLANRTAWRMQWINRLTSVCDLGFMTDGDWVKQDQTGRLVWLLQGADERVVGFGDPKIQGNQPPLLFAGARGHGTFREEQFDELIKFYGPKLRLVEGNRRLYRRDLANCIASAQITLAPLQPVTDHYWSNRVYMACGFGAFLMHPFSENLSAHYQDGEEIIFYDSNDNLKKLVDRYLPLAGERARVSLNALQKTKDRHLYRRRVASLVKTVQERLL